MRIPNFKSEEGSILYKNTVGRLISPRVADVMLVRAFQHVTRSTMRNILDLGCGPGTLSIPIAAEYQNLLVTAVDSSDSMISLGREEAAKRNLNNIVFQTMDAGHIHLEPESFDLALCNLAFPFFPKPFDSMRELFTVVRPGGTVLFTVPGRHTWEEFFKVAASILGDMVTMAKPFLHKFAQAEILPEAIKDAGFGNLKEISTSLPFHFENGQAVLDFFSELFHLLDYAPNDMKAELADSIDCNYPNGFTMHYEAVLLSGERPVLP